MDVTVLF